MANHEFYLFRVRDPISGKWGQTRYRITDQTARERYGANYERIHASREVRTGYAERVAFDQHANQSSG